MNTIPATTPEPGSARDRQARAHAAASELMTFDLPEIGSVMVTREGELKMQTFPTLVDGGDLAAVHEWAGFLGVTMEARDYNHPCGRVHIVAEATFGDVPVEVWTSILTPEPRVPVEAAPADGETDE